jgi:hypothetical protein
MLSLVVQAHKIASASVARVLTDQHGAVVLLELQLAEFEAAGRFQFVYARILDAWAHPALLHGWLYLRYLET